MARREAVLFLFVSQWGGMHLTAWRDPSAPVDPALDFGEIVRMVQTAERGKLHGFFLADTLALWSRMSREALTGTAFAVHFDPMMLGAALATVTDRIGLLLTTSTTYNEPFHVARAFASLDHLSGGRAGWNVVTSANPDEAANFGREEHMGHELRYARGQEFVDVVTGLWDSWDDDAFVRDKVSGVYFDPAKLHRLDHRGEHLSVAGPLTVSRPPQGHPVISQAGSSTVGRRFAARIADIVYTLQSDLDEAKAFYAEVKRLVAAEGRDPDAVKVMPGIIMVVGRTQAEADERLGRLDALVEPRIGLEQLATFIDYDLSGLPLDGPVPEIPETRLGPKTLQKHFVDMARRDDLTIRQFIQVGARAGAIAGTPQSIADRIEEWIDGDAADGFNITFADAGESLDVFVEHVVPELQRRGVFHADYAGATLRENLGLPRPLSRYATTDRRDAR